MLRLRQIACDPTLCPREFIDDVRAGIARALEAEHADAEVLPPEDIKRLGGILREMCTEAVGLSSRTKLPFHLSSSLPGTVLNLLRRTYGWSVVLLINASAQIQI